MLQQEILDLYPVEMGQDIPDVYARGESFMDYFAHDLDDGAVWFNPEEFGRAHNINGVQILAVFTTDTRSQALDVRVGSTENPEGVFKSRGLLFVRAQELEDVNAEQSLRLDGRLYTVAEARKIQDQVWRIVLEANES